MRKDILAAGGRKATYAVTGKVGEEIELKNVMSEEDRIAAEKEQEAFLAKVEDKVTIDELEFIPTQGVLLVRQHEAVNPSGILITETLEKEKPSEGTVLAVGPKTAAKIGDHVVFGKYAGAEFKLNGEVLLLISIDEIKGTLRKKSKRTIN